MENSEIFYQKLRTTLEETTTFPTSYIYKFIIPNNNSNVFQLMKLFDSQGAVITSKDSKTTRYKSFTIQIITNSVDEIIQKYKDASSIEGIISL